MENMRKQIKSKKVPTPVEVQRGVLFSREKLDFALLESFDLMQRALLDGKYVLCGEGARCLKENKPLECDKLEFIIEKRYVIPEVISMLKDWTRSTIHENGFEWFVGGVPLTFRFIEGNYDHFKYADHKIYGPESYKIPNQWNDYWENRDSFV